MKRQRFVVEITNLDSHDKTSYKNLAIALEEYIQKGGYSTYSPFPFYLRNAFVLRRPTGLTLRKQPK